MAENVELKDIELESLIKAYEVYLNNGGTFCDGLLTKLRKALDADRINYKICYGHERVY
jgi:hypothetical protein